VTEVLLTRDPADRRRNDLPGIGTVQFTSAWGNKAVLSAPGHPEWHLRGRLMFRDVTHVADQTGIELGTFTRSKRAIEVGGRTLVVRMPKESLTSGPKPVELLEDERMLARYAPWAWDGERPVTVTLLDEEFARAEPLMVLLGLYGTLQYAIMRSAKAATGNA
jgi:hypothetical protein